MMIYPGDGVTLVSSCHAVSRDRVSLPQFIARGRGGSPLDPASVRQYDLQHSVHLHTGEIIYLLLSEGVWNIFRFPLVFLL